MIREITAAAILVAGLTGQPAVKGDIQTEWVSIGEYRITTYCEYCNEPQGHETASGKHLEYGQVAMNGVPFGTKIAIEGAEFVVTDRCGFDDTVDIFVPSLDGTCTCNTLEYKDVRMKTGDEDH